MDAFETVYIPNNLDECTKSAECSPERLKFGEVFQVRQNHFVFICVHCSKEFENFVRFTAHVQSHFQAAFQWVNGKHTQPNTTAASTTMEHIEWLASESGDEPDYNPDTSEMLAAAIDQTSNNRMIHGENAAFNDSATDENGEELQSIKYRFGLRHPLIDVKDVQEARALLPYFSKKYRFDKSINQQLKCPLCDYMSIFKSSIREHILTHATAKIFTCKLCPFECDRPCNLREHIEQTHCGMGPLTSEQFGRKFKMKRIDPQGNLNEANIAVAKKVKIEPGLMLSFEDGTDRKNRLECHICHKQFSKANGIVKHMKVHAQERNHQCFVCGAQFIRSDHLNRHKLCHEEPKFKCDICDLAFRRSDKLLAHRRKHPEPMNFTCSTCGLGFTEVSSVKTHIGFHCKGKTGIEETTTTELSITNPTDEHETTIEQVFGGQNNATEPIVEISEHSKEGIP